jgi:carbon monoxide dehydrogenase subunit G
MLTIESAKSTTSKSPQEVYDFLVDLNNLEKLMPEGKVENWRSTDNTCRFAIKNLATIGMKVENTQAPHTIELVSDGKNPFPFSLTLYMNNHAEGTEAYFEFKGEVNMFMQTMIKKPLKTFFDGLVNALPNAI